MRRLPDVDLRVVRALVAHDLTAVRRSPALVVPIVLLPALLLVLLPFSVGVAARSDAVTVERYLDLLPRRLAEPILELPADERLIVLILGYLVAPLFLIVPLMVSAVLAADSFAGEKDRRTLEALLHTPVRERELYLAKLAGAFLPALAVSWGGFALFAAVANAVGWGALGRVFVPTGLWLVLIGWIAPASAALGLGIMVRVSMRARTTQEAQQVGGAVVVPLTVAAVAQATYLLLYPVPVGLAVGAAVWLVALVLNGRGARRFTRDRVATRM